MRETFLVRAHPHRLERLVHAAAHLVLGQSHVQGAESHILEHGRREELVIGVLEDESHQRADDR